MTREEIFALDMSDLEQRSLAIAEEVKTAESDALEALDAELTAIEERKAEIKAEAEEKRAAMLDVIKGEGEPIEVKQEERKTMDSKEIRSSKEYIDAYAEYLKTGDATECRALLTENVDGGTIAVPVFVEERIHTAWENNEIVRRARRTFFKGNLRVGYEQSASPAVAHMEGGEAISEEELVIAYVELIPSMIKKMVRVSDECMALKGQEFIDYLYDEVEYQIVKLAGDAVVVLAAIDETGLVAESEAAGAELTTADIIAAEGLLGGEATNPVVITTRANAAALKAAALSANYGYDPFDGMDVIYVDATPLGDSLAIIADLSGAQINLPEGDGVKFKFDDLTEAAADIVRIIGRLYAAIGIVAPGKFVRVVAK